MHKVGTTERSNSLLEVSVSSRFLSTNKLIAITLPATLAALVGGQSTGFSNSPDSLRYDANGVVSFEDDQAQISITPGRIVRLNDDVTVDCGSSRATRVKSEFNDRVSCTQGMIRIEERHGVTLKLLDDIVKVHDSYGNEFVQRRGQGSAVIERGGLGRSEDLDSDSTAGEQIGSVADNTGISITPGRVRVGSGILVDRSGIQVGGIHINRHSKTMTTGEGGVIISRAGITIDPGAVHATEKPWREGKAGVSIRIDDALSELRATETEKAIVLDLSEKVLFDFDSSSIKSAASSTLAKLAEVVRKKLNGQLIIDGHTDSKGSSDYNQVLSESRARAVMAYLRDKEGIPADLMLGHGYGENRPKAYNTLPDGSDNPEGREQNRRVEITIEKVAR